jgi:hypothetical protein
MKNKMTSPKWRKLGKQGRGGFMKNEILSLLLDEKICFIRLPLDTLQSLWQVTSEP